MKTINSIFKTFVLGLVLFSQVQFARAQTAALLPVAPQQFFDKNGNPVSSGSVGYYIPGQSTPKTVWQDDSQTVPWTNPITLNAGGWPPNNKGIYGNGTYRQIVKDKFNNVISDQPTSATGSGGGSGTNVGDGNSVGTVLIWGGMIAPNQYQFAYGQALSRTTFAPLFQALTQSSTITCTGGNTTLTGITDTSNIPIGAAIEGTCVPIGATVVSKTINTVTISIAANVSTQTTVRIFPYGNGDGSTTFNVMDLRGKVIPGRSNMGGVVSSNLTSTYYGSGPDAVYANGGNQSSTLSQSNLPNVNFNVIIPAGQGSHSHTYGSANFTNQGDPGVSNFLGVDSSSTTSPATLPQMSGTAASGGSGTAFSRVMPAATMNYVVKVTPDVSVSGLFGVASIGGMQGIIACGTGVTCAGNIISVSVPSAAGSNTQVQYNNNGALAGDPCFFWINPALILGANGACTGQLKIAGATSGILTQTVATVAGTPIITWGNGSGTPAVSATSPLVLNTTTGNLTLTTVPVSSGGTGASSFTAGVPLIGNGASPITTGTKTGNTNTFVTSTGTRPSGNCVQWDANGNAVDAGSVCGGGGGGASTVANIAALRALAPAFATAVYVNGYTNAGDGGQGWFSWVGSSSVADNNCTVFQPSTLPATGRWVRQNPYQGQVSVAWCGIFADSITDIGPALQNLITNVIPPNGGVVLFPATTAVNGFYNLATTVTGRNNVEIKGVASVEQNTCITGGTCTGTVIQWSGATSGRILDLRDTVGAIVDNITFMVGGTYTGIIVDIGATVVSTKVSFYANIRNSSFVVTGAIGTSGATCINGDRAIEWIVYRNQFVNCATGIRGRTDPDTLAIQSTTATISNNQFYKNKVALSCGGDGWNVTYNTFEGDHLGRAQAYQSCGTLKTRAMYFAYNWMGDVTASGGAWFNINSSSSSFTVDYNFISGEATNTDAVYFGGGTQAGISFSNNQFDTLAVMMFVDTGVTVTNGTVQNNVGTSVSNCIGGTGGGSASISRFSNSGFTTTCEIQSLAVTGYKLNPDTTIDQWGQSVVTAGTPLAVTFPKAFSSACFNATATLTNVSSGTNQVYMTTSCSTTGMTLNVQGTGANNVYWRAIGR